MANPKNLLSDLEFAEMAKNFNMPMGMGGGSIAPANKQFNIADDKAGGEGAAEAKGAGGQQGQAQPAQAASALPPISAGPAPHEVRVWGKSGMDKYAYGSGGAMPVASRVDFPKENQQFVQDVLNSSTPEMLTRMLAQVSTPGGVPKAPGPQFDTSSWPKTLGWSGAAAAGPTGSSNPRDFFGAGGNILSGMTDLDRLTNPMGYEMMQQGLQRTLLGDAQAQDRLGFDRDKLTFDKANEQAKTDALLKQAQINANAHIKAAEIGAGAQSGPNAIKGTVLTELVKQYGNDEVKLRDSVSALSKAMGVIEGQMPGQIPTPAAVNGDQQSADQAILDIRKTITPQITTAPDQRGGPLNFDSGKGVESIEKLADSLNTTGAYKNPTALKQMVADIDKGLYGDPKAVWAAIAQGAGANQILTQMPPDFSSDFSPISEFPTQYHVPGVTNEGTAYTLERAPSAGNAQFGVAGSALRQANAGWLPYTQIRLRDGTVIPFNPSDAMSIGSALTGSLANRRKSAPARAATLTQLLEGRGQ